MKRALVTGGAGFLGSHLCERLLKKGYSVICIDNLITGAAENIKHLFENPDFTYIQQDVTKYIDIEGDLDWVFHFASPASPIDYLKYPIQTLKVGALGTHNALGLAKAKRAKFMLASTSEVYGDPQVHPQPEDYWGNVNPIGPRGVYDEAKRFAEALTMAYHREHDIDIRIVRIFNTYGPRIRTDDGRVIPTFVTQALKGENLTVFGDGSQTRSFCYVEDLIDGVMKLMEVEYHLPMNLGNPQEVSVLELAQLVIKLTGSKSKIKFLPLPQDDPKVRRPDITRAKTLLHWQPKVELKEGLLFTIEYFKHRLKIDS
ncbi:MAG: SDR family NAD-dependent epimerase/dehydratase [Candidatus Omnitrophota bacterium]|nr:MAG: SDR family NAD-dependent epimerase/dehydratase [Candidatus Omnitrophota bacterium]